MPDSLDFTGWRVALAGASRGIGRAMALAFLARGASVMVCARGQDGLDALVAAAGDAATRLHVARCDVADAAAIKAWIEDGATELGALDVLVNNASGYGFDADDDAAWLADFNVDLMAAVRASRAALPYLCRSSHASILHTSSISAQRPRPQGTPYGAMKAALDHLTRSQALRLAPGGIRVNAIAPGSIEFDGGMWDRMRHDDPERYRDTLAHIPFGRYGTPVDIANAALFLASPLAAWVTGQVITVDGGQLLRG